jgi:amino acid transporter
MLLGIKDSAKFNSIMTILNISNIALIILAGTYFVSSTNLTPFFPQQNVVSKIIKSFPYAYFGLIGFDTAACMTQETKDAKVYSYSENRSFGYSGVDPRSFLHIHFHVIHTYWVVK